ncbi:hypothetical protein RU95_GL001349 [Enterococcus avium]|nr:hypothetical protein RU95_GL001349 [Enterococcus avium]
MGLWDNVLSRALFASPTFAVAQGRTGKNKILKAGINTRGLVGWYA